MQEKDKGARLTWRLTLVYHGREYYLSFIVWAAVCACLYYIGPAMGRAVYATLTVVLGYLAVAIVARPKRDRRLIAGDYGLWIVFFGSFAYAVMTLFNWPGLGGAES